MTVLLEYLTVGFYFIVEHLDLLFGEHMINPSFIPRINHCGV